MMTVEPTKDLTAIGRLAGRLGVDRDAVLAVAERLSLTPALRVDHVVFFDRHQVEQLSNSLKESGARRQTHGRKK